MRPLLLLIAGLALAPHAAGQEPSAPPTAGAPVVLRGDTLFTISARLGPFTPAERAAAVRSRLERLARDPMNRPDTIFVYPGESSTDIAAGDVVLVSITDTDALAAGVSRAELARAWAGGVAEGLRQESLLTRLRVIGVGVLFALLVTIAAWGIVRLINRFFPRLFEAIERGRGSTIPALRIQRLQLLSSDQLADGLLAVARLARILILALLLYISVPIILSFFPWTQGYAERLFGYILTPFAVLWTGFLSYLPNLFALGAIALVTAYLLKLIRLFFIGIARGTLQFSGFYPEWGIPTYKIVRMLVLIFAFIAAWPYLPGSDSEAFRGVGVFVGLLISLGSASAVSNIIGGVLLTYMRPFRVGDRVKIAETEGDIVEKSLLVTRIRTIKNVEITVPNAMVLGSHIVNYSASAKSHGLILETTVTIGYDAPWRQVHALLLEAAATTPDILKEPAPFVLQTGLDDFYVAYQLNAFTDQPNRMAATYSALHANIQDAFNRAGVEIMSPHYRAARDGNRTTIPPEHLPPDYRPPGFRVVSAPEHGTP